MTTPKKENVVVNMVLAITTHTQIFENVVFKEKESFKNNAAIFSEKTNIEDLTFNFPHSKGQIQVDTTPSHKSNSMIWIFFIRHYLKITK